jgi:Tfp pilus assembly protein PilP
VSRKSVLIFVAIGLLLALNLWRWLPDSPAPDPRTSGNAAPELDELQLRVANVDIASQPMRRDLFFRVAPPARTTQAQPARRTANPPTPVKSPEETARELAESEFAAIRVIGIVFRHGRGQAYLESGGKSELVGVGDTFGSFEVTAIRQDSVELRDAETSAGGKISLAGS